MEVRLDIDPVLFSHPANQWGLCPPILATPVPAPGYSSDLIPVRFDEGADFRVLVTQGFEKGRFKIGCVVAFSFELPALSFQL